MRTLTLLSLLLLPALVWSQQPQFDQDKMQRMMQQAAQMQACFAQVDQKQLEVLAEKAKGAESDIKALCRQGERAKAKTAAIEFGMEIAKSEEMRSLRKCGEMVQEMLPPLLAEQTADDAAGDSKHVCDAL